MRGFFRTAVVLLLAVCGKVIADDGNYRIAGLIASGADDWQAIIEQPDGEQMMVEPGDFIGRIEVVDISRAGVTLQFPEGRKQMRLSEGGYFAPAEETLSRPQNGSGVSVGEYSRLLKERLDPDILVGVRGLETLDRLSASARIVSYSYLGDPEEAREPVESVEAGVRQLHQAIVDGREIRVTVEGDESVPDFYVMPAIQQ